MSHNLRLRSVVPAANTADDDVEMVQDSQLGNLLILVRAMIDSGATRNVISQLKVKEHDIPASYEPSGGLRTLSGDALRTYQGHDIDVGVRDSRGISLDKISLYIGPFPTFARQNSIIIFIHFLKPLSRRSF